MRACVCESTLNGMLNQMHECLKEGIIGASVSQSVNVIMVEWVNVSMTKVIE